VYRVVSDGVRDLSRVADRTDLYAGGILNGDIAAGLDGSVWWFGPDSFFRLGEADMYAWSESDALDGVWAGDDIGVTPDGTLLRYSDPEHAAAFDGRSWTEREVEPTAPAIWLRGDGLHFYDGERWKILATPFSITSIDHAAMGADGTTWISHQSGGDFSLLARSRLATPSQWEEFSRGLPRFERIFEVAPDGSVWISPIGDEDCNGIASFDGTAVTYHLSDTCVHALDIAPDGRVWLQAGETGGGTAEPGGAPTIHTYVITPEAVAAE
jgi:hypothetical protein